MRAMAAIISCLSASVLLLLGSYSYGEPEQQPAISFSLAYQCRGEKDGKKTQTFCLADSLTKELSVVLVSK